MEFLVFGICLTIIVALVLLAHYESQQRTSDRNRDVYTKALEMQNAVIQELRFMRVQQQTERSQVAAERSNTLRTLNYLIAELRKDKTEEKEEVRFLLERLRIDLVQCVGDAAADAMGVVRGERVMMGAMGSDPDREAVSMEEGDTSLDGEQSPGGEHVEVEGGKGHDV